MISALTLYLAAFLQKDAIYVRVNGVMVNPGKVFHSRTMVPTRGVLEKLGVEVRWVPASRSVIASNADTTIVLWIGRPTAQVNGRDLPLDTPPFIEAGTTYVPLRFIAEAMNAKVGYDSATNTASVDLGVQTTEPTKPVETPTQPTGELKPIPSNWFIPGRKMRFQLAAAKGQDLTLSFSPDGVSQDISLREISDGLYEGAWTPPTGFDYGEGTVKATVLKDGRPFGKEVELCIDDPKLIQVSPQPGQAFEGAQLWVKMRENTGPGFDVNAVTVTANGRDVTRSAQISEQDVKLDLTAGQNDIGITIRDQAGKDIRFETSVFVASKRDPYLSYEAPNPVKPGDLIKFRVQGPAGTPFAIMLGNSIRIPFDQIHEVRPGYYEATYVVGENDQLDNAPVRAVFDRGRDPLTTSPLSIVPLRVDRVRAESISGGTLVQAVATPGCRLSYVGPDGSVYDFTEQVSYPGSYLLTIPLPDGPVASQVRPYVRLRAPNGQPGWRNISFFWPERELRLAKVEPSDRARLSGVPSLVKASVDNGGGPGIDPASLRMWLDSQSVRDISLFAGSDISFKVDPALGAGDHTVDLDARDRLGRSIRKSWTFTVKGTPVVQTPRISLFEFQGRGDVTGGQSTTAQFKVEGVPDDAMLVVTSAAPGIVGVPQTVRAGDGTFNITTRPVDRRTTVNITLSYGAVKATLPLTLEPGEAAPVLGLTELVAMPNRDHDAPKVARVSLNSPAPAGGVVVKLTNLTPNILKCVSSATVRAGNTQVGFAIASLGVDSTQTAQIRADLGGTFKILRFNLIPARLGVPTGPDSVKPGSNFRVVFELRSPVGPSGAVLNLGPGIAKILGVPTQYKVPAGATSVSLDFVAPANAGPLSIAAELNGSRVAFKLAVSP